MDRDFCTAVTSSFKKHNILIICKPIQSGIQIRFEKSGGILNWYPNTQKKLWQGKFTDQNLRREYEAIFDYAVSEVNTLGIFSKIYFCQFDNMEAAQPQPYELYQSVYLNLNRASMDIIKSEKKQKKLISEEDWEKKMQRSKFQV